jgi:hypothetical protein
MTLNNVLLLLIIIFILYLTFTTLYCNYVSVKEGLFETKKSEVREISETSIGSGITHYNGETLLPLKEYIIKSSYNTAISGNYVSKDMIKYVLTRGCRAIDFEVLFINMKPYVTYTTDNTYKTYDTENKILLDDALMAASTFGFSYPCPNTNDPLFINIRLKCNKDDLSAALTSISKSVDFALGSKLYDKKITDETTLNDVMKKVVLIFDNTLFNNYENDIECDKMDVCYDLSKQVNIQNGSLLSKYSIMNLDEVSVKIDSNDYVTLRKISMGVPEYYNENGKIGNLFANNFVNHISLISSIQHYGIQMLYYRYYVNDSQLQESEQFFKGFKSAIIPFNIAIPYINRIQE